MSDESRYLCATQRVYSCSGPLLVPRQNPYGIHPWIVWTKTSGKQGRRHSRPRRGIQMRMHEEGVYPHTRIPTTQSYANSLAKNNQSMAEIG